MPGSCTAIFVSALSVIRHLISQSLQRLWLFLLPIYISKITLLPQSIPMFLHWAIGTGWRVFPIPPKYFFILEMLKGYGKVDPRFDMRMPLSVPILTKIFQLCPSILYSHYVSTMFKAMCAMAFYAFCALVKSQSPNNHQLCYSCGSWKSCLMCPGTLRLKVTFYFFKHHYNEPPLSVVFTRQPVVCPVDALLVYLQFRGCRPGPRFQHLDGSPVTRSEFCDWLARAIKSCGLNPDRYKGHSFRIGAASHAAECGYSETQIRLLG